MDQIIADTGTRDQVNGATKKRTKDHLPTWWTGYAFQAQTLFRLITHNDV